jgi:6-pyruvoyltetrahydropterin/6-carboxytetrahydropterin synthase
LKIYKRFSFDAAHRLPDWPDIHGHSYRAEVWFEGPVVDGYVIREAELTALTDAVRARLDHRFLNDIIPLPTSENIAKFLWEEFRAAGNLVKVVVLRESCGLGVEYSGESG